MTGAQQLMAILYVSTLVFIAVLLNIAPMQDRDDDKEDE